MDRIDFRIIMLRIAALPIACFICTCSCALTCRFLLLGEPTPVLTGEWWTDPAALGYIVKLSGGIAVSTAQVFGVAIYTLKLDNIWRWIYIGATAISVTISVLTFQSLIQSGAINAKHNSAEYQNMTAEQSRLIKGIARQREEKERIISGFLKYDKVTRSSEVVADYEARIERYEAKLRDVQRRLSEYSTYTDSKDFVSASTTYDALGSDVVGFFGFPKWVGGKLAFLLSYAMLIAVALAIDMTGTRLFSFALGDAKQKTKTANAGAECGAKSIGEPAFNYTYQPFKSGYRGREESTIKSTGSSGAESGVEFDGPLAVESGAEVEEVPASELDIDPDLVAKIIEAYGTEKSINAIQNKVWETGKSSRRRKMVLAVGEAYGLKVGKSRKEKTTGHLRLVVSNQTV